MIQNALRPTFTSILFNRLKEGRSINLVGLRGAGCSRALRDVIELANAEEITTIYIDLNKYKYNYSGFEASVREQLLLPPAIKENSKLLEGANETLAVTTYNDFTPVSVLLDESKSQHNHIFILLDHFDALLNDPRQRLPKIFYDDLNSINNQYGFSLCCVTEKPHLQYRVHYKDEQGALDVSLSWLDLQHINMTNLLDDEIHAELDRMLRNIPAWQNEPQKDIYIRTIAGQLHPVRYIDLLKTNLEIKAGLTAEQRLFQIGKQYAGIYNNRPKPKSNWDKLLERLVKFSEVIRNIRGKS